MKTTPEQDTIDFLVKRKFPNAQPFSLLGTMLKTDHKSIENIQLPASELYRRVLQSKSNDEIQVLYNQEFQEMCKEEDKVRFFNERDAGADFDYWAKMPEWTIEEAVALSFGKSPEIVTKANVQKIPENLSPFVQAYNKIEKLIIRAKKAKLFSDAKFLITDDPIRPYKFVDWARGNGINFPDELIEKVIKAREQNTPPKTEYEQAIEKLNATSDHQAAANALSQRAKTLYGVRKKQTKEKIAKDLEIKAEPSSSYTPAYIEFMLEAVTALELSADQRANLDEIVGWLTQNWPDHLEGKSDRLIRAMATLIRRPQDKKGGNTSWKALDSE